MTDLILGAIAFLAAGGLYGASVTSPPPERAWKRDNAKVAKGILQGALGYAILAAIFLLPALT